MAGNTPLIPDVPIAREYELLNNLLQECEQFLRAWKAYDYGTDETRPDAVIAIFELQVEVIARRAYILALLDQRDLPF